jgi:hypothetical protein
VNCLKEDPVRKWGIVITAVYALILLAVLVPGAILLGQDKFHGWPALFRSSWEGFSEWIFWIPTSILVFGQALLLFLSVDTSQKRLKPRAHILVSCAVGGVLTALLTSMMIWSLGFVIRGENFWDHIFETNLSVLAFWAGLWLLWGILFYVYFRNSSEWVTRIISWLLKGSVLELLIVVPCHVIVRRRHDCSAPVATSFGIATGIAIMLLSFGPSILLLYKKRLDEYSTRNTA